MLVGTEDISSAKLPPDWSLFGEGDVDGSEGSSNSNVSTAASNNRAGRGDSMMLL
jgi:hypothetical protein